MIARRAGKLGYLKWAVVASLIIALGTVILWPTIKVPLKEQFKEPYLRYSKWRYGWRSPSDVGDGKNALEVIIEGPMGIAEDAFGAIYVSDREGKFVWKIEPSGRTTVVAGNGLTTGPSGLPASRTPARDVALASPEGLVVERDGDILLADSYNNSVLKIDSGWLLDSVRGKRLPWLQRRREARYGEFAGHSP